MRLFRRFLSLKHLKFLVNEFLLALDILEHVFAFTLAHSNEGREHLVVGLVEMTGSGQTL